MVQPADMRHAPNGAGSLNAAPERRILVQGEVRSNGIVISGISTQCTAQMCLVEDDQMIETFPVDGSDRSLDVSVLPSAARGDRPVSDAHRLDAALEYLAI